MNQHAIVTEIQGEVARIWLNRPDARNALNMALLKAFFISLQKINANAGVRIICIRGRGNSFCAGADLHWMQQATSLSWEDNYMESTWMARCYHELFASDKITLACVHGAAFGGALGLLAACDLAITTESAVLAFSEVKLGLVPATIAPYVLHKAANAKVLEFMLTGKKFNGSFILKG